MRQNAVLLYILTCSKRFVNTAPHNCARFAQNRFTGAYRVYFNTPCALTEETEWKTSTLASLATLTDASTITAVATARWTKFRSAAHATKNIALAAEATKNNRAKKRQVGRYARPVEFYVRLICESEPGTNGDIFNKFEFGNKIIIVKTACHP